MPTFRVLIVKYVEYNVAAKDEETAKKHAENYLKAGVEPEKEDTKINIIETIN